MSAQMFSISQGPPEAGYSVKRQLDANGNPLYEGYARSQQQIWQAMIADGQFTNIVVLTNVGTINWTAHGLEVGMTFWLDGATVAPTFNNDLTSAPYVVATVPNANSITFTTVGVANATYTDATLRIRSRAPRSSAPIWAVKAMTYAGDAPISSRPLTEKWASGGATSENQIWDNRAALAYQ